MLLPVTLLYTFFLGLLALALPILGIVLLRKATRPPERRVQIARVDGKDKPPTREVPAETRVLRWTERLGDPAVFLPLVGGLLLLLLPLYGRTLSELRYPAGQDEPVPLHGEVHELKRADGTTIHAEIFGPAGAPVLILNHGWSTDNTEWYYAKRQLAGRFRVIVWDLPGSGQTMSPADNDFSLERMATDLHLVLALADGKPAVVVGHSIGGMTNLTFAKLFPQDLGTRVAGFVQVDTSYTNPVMTAKDPALNRALQKPVAEPLLHVMIPLSPVFRAMNWVSYQEGLAESSNARSAFDGTETRGQLDLVSRYGYETSPAVVARGTLAMFHWDMTPELPRINVPTLMIVGKDDTTTLPAASQTMAGTIPKAQLVILSIGRHYSLLESNTAVDNAIAAFASGVAR